MSQELEKNTLLNEAKKAYPLINSSGNSQIHYSAEANNNTHNITNNIIIKNIYKGIRETEPIINNQKSLEEVHQISDVQSVQMKVIPFEIKIKQLIWNHLSFQDNINCTMASREFNEIVNEMDCFRLNLDLTSSIPKLTRSYKTMIIEGYKCVKLKTRLRRILQHLSTSLIELKLLNCEFVVMTLYDFLSELPLLESLELNISLIMNWNLSYSEEDLPQLLYLKDFKLNIKEDVWNETLAITRASLNIKSLSFINTNFKKTEFNKYIKSFKNLNSLSLSKCNFIQTYKMYGLNISFDCLKELRFLHLDEVNTEMLNIIRTKWIRKLTKFELNCQPDQWEIAEQFFQQCCYKHCNIKFVAKRKLNNIGVCILSSKTDVVEIDTFDDPFDLKLYEFIHVNSDGISITNTIANLCWN